MGGTTVYWAAAAVVLVLTSSAAVAEEATVLADSELDAVTAAGVAVDVNSVAAAVGDATRTFTDANTSVIDGKSLDLGIGLTTGKAFACCGEGADVAFGSVVNGVGDIVQRGIRAIKYDDGVSVDGLSAGFVIAVSYKDPLEAIQELRPALMSMFSGVEVK
jgi:hypothetical protein